MNLYKDKITGVEWVYYIDDNNALWRVNDSGTVDEHIRDNCAYIFIIGTSLIYATEDNRIYETGVFNLESIREDQGLLHAEAASPFFGYRDDYWMYYESFSPLVKYRYRISTSNIVMKKQRSYVRSHRQVVAVHAAYVLYVSDGNLYAAYFNENKAFYMRDSADSGFTIRQDISF